MGEPSVSAVSAPIAPAASGSRAAGAPRRIPGLDGLRAISIVCVILSHLQMTREVGAITALHRLGDLGNLGVRVFFVISGYLITTLLLGELDKTGTVDLKAFYLRRAFRIFPAFYAFLAIIGVLAIAGVIAIAPRDIGLAAVYVINFVPERAWYVGHAWSLAVEEQFYLLWPLGLWAARRSRGLWVAVLVFAIAPFVRIGMWFFLPDSHALIGEAFPTVADAIACGCILAILGPKLSASATYLRWLRSPLFVLVPLIGFADNLMWRHARFFFGVGTTILNVAIALTVDRCVRAEDGLLKRILNAPALVWLGGLSYSLYLWQQLFLSPEGAGPLVPFPLNLAAALGCAVASYYLVETPMLRLRARLEKRRPARAQPAV